MVLKSQGVSLPPALAAKKKPSRRDFRAEVPPALVRGLALWRADAVTPGQALDPGLLGRPLMRRDGSRAYGLHVANLSAGGMGLHIHNPRLDGDGARALGDRRFLVRLDLDGAGGPGPLTLLLLARARRVEARPGGALVALEFTARARWMKSAGTLHLAPLRGRGVDALASWVARGAQPAPEDDAEADAAWYEDLR